MDKSTIFENLKAIISLGAVTSNSVIQWLSSADTFMKLIATALTIPAGIFFARFMYYQGKLKKLQIEQLQKEIDKEK
tara:strand:- start:70 stop:300 length:231 start_codon:yes stop_codon:yes gene_type:complete